MPRIKEQWRAYWRLLRFIRRGRLEWVPEVYSETLWAAAVRAYNDRKEGVGHELQSRKLRERFQGFIPVEG